MAIAWETKEQLAGRCAVDDRRQRDHSSGNAQRPERRSMWGFQLWANLPASQKMMAPRYRDVKSSQIPEVKTDNGTRIKVVCGEINKVKGPVQDIVTDPEYLDISVQPQSTFKHLVKKGHTCFAYVVDGAGSFDQRQDPYAYEKMGTNYFDFNRNHLLDNETLILFDDGDEVVVTTIDKTCKISFILGNL